MKYHLRLVTKIGLLTGMLMAIWLVHASPKVQASSCAAPPADYGTDTMNITAPSSGSYVLWVRMQVPDTTNNAINAEVDGSTCFNVGGSSSITPNTWTWVNY